MQPQSFAVQADLATPIILSPETYLTLDSLLAAMIFEETGEADAALRDIPLQKTAGIWHGSAAFLTSVVNPFRAPFKRGVEPLEEMWIPAYQTGTGENSDKVIVKRIDKVRKKYQTLTGEYEAQAASGVLWFGCGDIVRVESIISGLSHVGKKARQGYGQISGVSVEEMDEDWSLSIPFKGRTYPMRPIPLPVWETHLHHPLHDELLLVRATSRPPYFCGQKDRCAVPHSHLQFWRAAAL